MNSLPALAVWCCVFAATLVTSQDPLANVNLVPDQLNSYGNNSLFLRWRQSFHFLAPAGHMNDPCGPMYDNLTDTYHLFYQSFPNHVNGGNGSWGHAISKDLVTWVDPKGWRDTEPLVLQPGPYPQYDWLGDWSGSAQPVSLKGKADGNLTIMFTCVDKFPVGWLENETAGSEEQCMATSSDGGLTWQKYEGNPVLTRPPEGWNFTGWRDPYFEPMPDIDALLGYEEPHYYLVLGSGIHGAGPRVPLYSAKATDLTKWTYLGALFDVPGNYSWSNDPFRTGSLGYNFELAGFNTLVEKEEHGGDGKTLHHIVNVGTEGGNNTYHPNPHWSMILLGDVSKRQNGSVQFDITWSGPMDWGNFYAATTFWDTKNDRRVLWGWSDEDLNSYGIVPQGFQGSLGLPREFFVLKTHNVAAPSDDSAKAQGIWTEDEYGTYTVTTFGTRPLPDVVDALHLDAGVSLGSLSVSGMHVLETVKSDHFHLKASMKIASSGKAGFIIRASPGMEEFTRIIYDPSNSTLTLDRTNSSLVTNFTKTNYQAFFQPYTLSAPSQLAARHNKHDGPSCIHNRPDHPNHPHYPNYPNSPSPPTKPNQPEPATTATTEPLNFDIFVDGSLLEIFINDRFALTSRVYPSRADALNIALFADGSGSDGGEAVLENVVVYTNMRNVWPERPLNSSSPLHYDPYYMTHVTYENVFGMPVGTKLYDGF